MTAAYGFVMTLIIAATYGPTGLFVFTVFWATVVYRATSSRRTVGGNLTTGEADTTHDPTHRDHHRARPRVDSGG